MAVTLGPRGAPLRTLALVLAGRPDTALPAVRAAPAAANGHASPSREGFPSASSADGPRSGGSGVALSLFRIGRARGNDPNPHHSTTSEALALGAGSGFDEGDAAPVLDDWQRNLAILAANRSPGDEAVLVRLGDRLWQERGMVRLHSNSAINGAMLLCMQSTDPQHESIVCAGR